MIEFLVELDLMDHCGVYDAFRRNQFLQLKGTL